MRALAAPASWTLLAVAAWLLLSSGCQRPAPPEQPAPAAHAAQDRLLDLMRQRLVLMHGVAQWKWNHKQPIVDTARERDMLRSLEERGRRQGLAPETTAAFFRAQVEASRELQAADFARWQREDRGPFPDAPDLARVLRPQIDALNEELLAALAQALPGLRPLDARASLEVRGRDLLAGDGIDAAIRETALHPLLHPDALRLSPSSGD